VEQLFTPGEPEWRRRQGAGGKIHMQPSVVAMLTRLASDLGLTSTPFQTTAKETRHA